MKYSLITFSFLFGFIGLSAASAANDIGEGYAATNFKELSQTMLLMGGLDINIPKVADEYARLTYCGLYQQTFKNDFEWNKIRSQIVARVLDKKEYYRVLYETSGIFKLGRYDTEEQYFPLSPDTAMANVGSMSLFSSDLYRPYCGLDSRGSAVFSSNITLVLNQPLTVNKIKFPQAEAENLLARMAATGNADRQLYGRIRFRITEAPGNTVLFGRVQSTVLRGDITAVDFFLDSEMTKPVASVPIAK
ncbi:MAG: DUF4852 domain-containing protein [Alphaproteobacteria bacterium]|nr:DUF4852 domain-containing protein [Alphaproteobacteria bacterium]